MTGATDGEGAIQAPYVVLPPAPGRNYSFRGRWLHNGTQTDRRPPRKRVHFAVVRDGLRMGTWKTVVSPRCNARPGRTDLVVTLDVELVTCRRCKEKLALLVKLRFRNEP